MGAKKGRKLAGAGGAGGEDEEDGDYEAPEYAGAPGDEKALRAEVAQFMAGIGLAPAAQDGFDDRDFRPKPESKKAAPSKSDGAPADKRT